MFDRKAAAIPYDVSIVSLARYNLTVEDFRSLSSNELVLFFKMAQCMLQWTKYLITRDGFTQSIYNERSMFNQRFLKNTHSNLTKISNIIPIFK